MNPFRKVRLWITRFFGIGRFNSDMDEEMRMHLELRIERNVEAGMSPEEARNEALRCFGGIDQIKERARDQRKAAWLDHFVRDLRFAARMILAHRWFSAAVVVTLALGIGINTTVFTLVNSVLFRPLPIPGGERLVTISGQNLKKTDNPSRISYPDFLEFRTQNRAFDGIESAKLRSAVLSDRYNPPERLQIGLVSAGMFNLLRTPPVLGRDFTASDDRPGAEAVALLSYGIWKSRYNGAPGVIGSVVRVNGAPATIIGVMPEGFEFTKEQQLWMPLGRTEPLEGRAEHDLWLFGLLKPTASMDAARADISVIAARRAAEFPDTNKDLGALVRTFQDTYNGEQVRSIFLMMLCAVGFVLLIACANVANMMLSRSIGRARELSVRAALGASRWQLVRQLLIESVLLSCLGGLVGLALAAIGVHAFDLATRDTGKPYWIVLRMDLTTYGYFAMISIGCGIFFGLVPALRASRIDLNTALKADISAPGGRRGGRLMAALVAAQMALTVVLLAAAGMMMRSFLAVQKVNPFVPAASILAARIELPSAEGERYADAASRLRFYDKLMSAVEALPGVAQAAVASEPPGLGASSRPIEFEGRFTQELGRRPRALLVVQSAGYLPLIRLPILMGRAFSETDGDPGREVAVVTHAFAEKYYPGQAVLGKRFRFAEEDKPGVWMTIIGVSADIVQETQASDAPPLVYISTRQEPRGGMSLILRTSSDPTSLAGPVRVAAQKLDQDLPLVGVSTLAAALRHQQWFLSIFGTLFLIFAAAGLVMASVGIYAVVAHVTARRSREIGIRMALGASASGVERLVLSRGLAQLVIGLLFGLGGGVVAMKLLAATGLLYQASPADPFVLAGISVLLVSVGGFACWLPARRAANVDPMVALRCE